MTENVRLYAGTEAGLYVWRSQGDRWTEVSRTLTDRVVDVIAGGHEHPHRAFAAVMHDGLYRTQDAGVSWTRVLDGDLREVTVDPTNDDVIYAGTEPVHLYRSEDGGTSWEDLTGLFDLPEEVRKKWWFPSEPHLGHIRDIFVHPDDPNTIYLCVEHGGILRSFDRGQTWEDVTQGIDYIDMHVLAALPGSRERYFTASAQGFYTSDAPEDGWVRAENGFTRDYFHHFVFLPSEKEGGLPTMLAATADGSPGPWKRERRGARAALFRSDDCAQSWHEVTEGLPDKPDAMYWGLDRYLDEPNSVLAALGDFTRGPSYRFDASGRGALYLSRDRGTSWTKLDIDLPAASGLWTVAE